MKSTIFVEAQKLYLNSREIETNETLYNVKHKPIVHYEFPVFCKNNSIMLKKFQYDFPRANGAKRRSGVSPGRGLLTPL